MTLEQDQALARARARSRAAAANNKGGWGQKVADTLRSAGDAASFGLTDHLRALIYGTDVDTQRAETQQGSHRIGPWADTAAQTAGTMSSALAAPAIAGERALSGVTRPIAVGLDNALQSGLDAAGHGGSAWDIAKSAGTGFVFGAPAGYATRNRSVERPFHPDDASIERAKAEAADDRFRVQALEDRQARVRRVEAAQGQSTGTVNRMLAGMDQAGAAQTPPVPPVGRVDRSRIQKVGDVADVAAGARGLGFGGAAVAADHFFGTPGVFSGIAALAVPAANILSPIGRSRWANTVGERQVQDLASKIRNPQGGLRVDAESNAAAREILSRLWMGASRNAVQQP